MNHKLLFSLVLLASTFSGLQAQIAAPASPATEVVESGKRLFIESGEDVTVTLDGKVLGNAPLLVDLGNRIEAVLQFDSPHASCIRNFRVNQAVTAITTFRPSLSPLSANILIGGTPETGIQVSVDGKAAELQAGRISGVQPGMHEITIMAPGLASMRTSVEVAAKGENTLVFMPLPGYALDFGPDMNPDSLLTVLGQDGKPVCTWHVSEKPLLPAGTMGLKIHDPARFRTWDLQGDPKDLSAAVIILDSGSSSASLVYRSDKANSSLAANRKVLTTSGNNKYAVPEGFTTITVTEGDCVVGTDIAVIPKNGQVDASIIREPLIIAGGDAQTKAEIGKDHSAFWVMLISGAAILGTSLVMNQDDVMISMTTDYETYSIGKYVTFGSTGLGIALMATSLFF